MRYALVLMSIALLNVWTPDAAYAACTFNGEIFQQNAVRDSTDGSKLFCNGSSWTTEAPKAPYRIKRAEFRNFDAPSQMPRCRAREGIENTCGTSGYCRLELNPTLCKANDRIESATHVEIVWKCDATADWKLQRIPVGTYWDLDCRR